jgi:hypothetical protein
MLGLEALQHHPLATGLLLATLAGCARPPVEQPARPLASVYCYQTLADVSCYTEPDGGRAAQLVNVYLRDPLDPAWPDPWLKPAGAWP